MLTSARSSNQWLEFWTGGCGFEPFVGERACVCICDALRRSTFYKDSPARLNASKFSVTSWWSLSQSRNSTSFIELKDSHICSLSLHIRNCTFSVRSFFLSFHYSCFILFIFFKPYLFFLIFFLFHTSFSLHSIFVVLLVFFLSAFLTFICSVFLKEKLLNQVPSTPYW